MSEVEVVLHSGDRVLVRPVVAVVDAWQRRGLATALLTRLAERADAKGVQTFTGDVQAANEPVRGLIRKLGVGTLAGTGPPAQAPRRRDVPALDVRCLLRS